jgi:predicted GH43/DUF377 family glycosyl hydrolase
MKSKKLLLLILSSFFIVQLQSLINLEDNSQQFVLKTRQIILDEYPHAFNPSIIQWDNKILLSFRVISDDILIEPDCNSSAESQIGLQWLDKNFNPLGKPQILCFKNEESAVLRSEDARLVKVEDKCYLVYSDNRESQVSDEGFRMHVTELIIEKEKISAGYTTRISEFEGEKKHRREKNWVPFDYCGNMMLAYSLSPHFIMVHAHYTTSAETICKTHPKITWNYGELRGGTPALKVNNEYLAFFHSSIDMATIHSKGKNISHYFIGAYTFSQHPPFEITALSPEPIITEGFYEGKEYEPYWKPVRVVFPCGYIMDNHYIYLSYGRQDHEIWIVQMDKYKLLESLVQVRRTCGGN